MSIGEVAELLKTREDGLRLLIAILAGYPLAAFYRTFSLYKWTPFWQHLYFLSAGIGLYIFCYGHLIYHALLSTLFAFLICNFTPGTKTSVVLAHIFFLGHLLAGYWFAESDQYDITWTTPFCIMTLRYIALVMDVFDGMQPKDKIKADQLERRIIRPPSLLETAAYGLFFAGTFVGPQFSLHRFRQFVNGEYLDPMTKEVRNTSLMPSIGRFVAATFYAVFHQWGAVWIPSDYLNSPQFFNAPFIWRCIWMTLWFRITMCRYCAAWLYTEGAAILVGLGYNGQTEWRQDRWDGVRDLHIVGWELGFDFQSVIESFNIGTNTFAKNHIFRRLRWLGNKYISHMVTLMYLAIWHGYHLGYFMLFFYEFCTIVAQEQFYTIIRRIPGLRALLNQWWMRPACWVFGRIVINVTMGFGFLTFGLVKKEIWIAPVMSMFFFGYVFYLVIWPLTYQILRRVLPRPRIETARKEE